LCGVFLVVILLNAGRARGARNARRAALIGREGRVIR